MTDKARLLELADLCEARSGPNYALESDIFRAVNPQATRYSIPKNYTASIDAAMTLIPKDMADEIEIVTIYQIARVSINLNHGPDSGPFYGANVCNSIPLAICAAALLAIADGRP